MMGFGEIGARSGLGLQKYTSGSAPAMVALRTVGWGEYGTVEWVTGAR